MSSAWSSYLGILLTGLVFMIGGGFAIWTEFEPAAGDRGKRKYGSRGGCIGIVFVVVGVTLALAMLFGSPTPWARQRLFDHIFRTPVDQIQRFVIKAGKPNQDQPLTRTDITIDDHERIERIAALLRTASEISPNRPHAMWTAQVEMVTRDGMFLFTVEATTPSSVNGTLITIMSSRTGASWYLGKFRADGLEKILEDTAGKRWQSR